MELRYYLALFRRWSWLLLLSVVLGAGAALLFSRLQTPVYEAVTWAMIVRPQETDVTASSSLTDQELADTFVALLTRRPVLDAASEAVGQEVDKEQVSAQLVRGTQLLEVTVEAGDPQDAATIANTLLQVLSAENRRLESSEFEAMETALQAQIAQVEEQIDGLQAEIEARKAETVTEAEAEQAELETRMDALQRESAQLQQEIDALVAPQLTDEEDAQLQAARAQQAELQLQLGVAQSVYEARLQATPDARDPVAEAEILDLGDQITALQETIDDLTEEGPVTDPADQAALVEKKASLAQKELALQTATTRYLQLEAKIVEAQDEESGGTIAEEATLELYQQLRGSLLSSFEAVRLSRLQNSSSLSVVEEATPPEDPVRPRPLINTVLGGLVALMGAAGLVFLFDYLDTSVKSGAEAAALTGLPVLGVIEATRRKQEPLPQRLVEAPDSRLAESFRTLRANLAFAAPGDSLRSILVTSPEAGDGKTTVAANLAATMAHGGKDVLLVDADLRDPGLGQLFGVPAGQPGQVGQPWKLLPRLRVLASGSLPRRPGELLDAQRMAELVGELGERAEVVVLDSSPLAVADAAILAPHVDGVLLVVRPGRTSLEALLAAVEQLQRAGAPLLGIALNRSPRRAGLYRTGSGVPGSVLGQPRPVIGDEPLWNP